MVHVHGGIYRASLLQTARLHVQFHLRSKRTLANNRECRGCACRVSLACNIAHSTQSLLRIQDTFIVSDRVYRMHFHRTCLMQKLVDLMRSSVVQLLHNNIQIVKLIFAPKVHR